MNRAVVVLPTYNEAGTIALVAAGIVTQQQRIPSHELHLLVVDDNSPDGTGGVVREMMRTTPRIHLLSGSRSGLGNAYKRGIAHALEHLSPDLVIQMDGDLQHDPAMLPLFVHHALQGYSLVIGSRFTAGGRTPGMPLRRYLLSVVGNGMLRLMSAAPPVRDCTSGFRCMTAELLRACDATRLPGRGYAYQAVLLLAMLENGAAAIEIPIEFQRRSKGRSKLTFRDQFEFAMNLVALGFKNATRLALFLK